MNKFLSYLQKIQRGGGVNFAAFEKLCKQYHILNWQKVLRFEHLGKQQYRAEILDNAAFGQWLERFKPTNDSRVAAAALGNSHAQNVSVSFLLRQNNRQRQPELVWLSDNLPVPPVSGKLGLVLENLENFHQFDAMLAVLKTWQPETDFQAADWLFGAGNQISNRLNQPYLQQYDALFCLFDWDVGGLQIFRNLKQMLPETRLQFALPSNPLDYLAQSNHLIRRDERSKLLEFKGLSNETDALLAAMLQCGKCLEQEIYLKGGQNAARA